MYRPRAKFRISRHCLHAILMGHGAAGALLATMSIATMARSQGTYPPPVPSWWNTAGSETYCWEFRQPDNTTPWPPIVNPVDSNQSSGNAMWTRSSPLVEPLEGGFGVNINNRSNTEFISVKIPDKQLAVPDQKDWFVSVDVFMGRLPGVPTSQPPIQVIQFGSLPPVPGYTSSLVSGTVTPLPSSPTGDWVRIAALMHSEPCPPDLTFTVFFPAGQGTQPDVAIDNLCFGARCYPLSQPPPPPPLRRAPAWQWDWEGGFRPVPEPATLGLGIFPIILFCLRRARR